MLGAIFLIVSALLASRLLGFFKIPEILTTIPVGEETQATKDVLLPTETATIQLTMTTATLEVQPTQTDIPITPTSIAPHLLETPIGHEPQLILHRVKEGEGFIFLASTYNTSPEAIKAVNLNMVDLLFANQVIVIPYNTSDVAGLPGFLVYEILYEEMTVETVAEELFVDIDDLIKYNDLIEGYRFVIGEWLLIPR